MKIIKEIQNNTKAQKNILIILKLLKKIMVIFSNIFLNVYIFKSLNGDFNLYLCGLIVAIIFAEIFSFIIFLFLSKKNSMIIYRASFILDALLIVLVLLIKTPTLPIIFMFYALQELSNCCFYGPHEIGEMKATNHKDSSKFLMTSTMMSSVIGIVSPFLNGLIINKISYALLFVIIGCVAIIMLVVSLFLKSIEVSSRKLRLKQFCKIAFKKKHMISYYFSFMTFRFSVGGTIYIILPVLLYMKTNSEFTLGIYSSIFAALTILSLLICMFVKNKKILMYTSIIFICLSCIALSIWSIFCMFIIFNAIYYSFGKIYENEIYSTRLNVIKTNELSDFKKEHHIIYDIFANSGYILGYLLIMLFYNVIASANALTLSVAILGLVMLVSLYCLIKAQKYYNLEIEKEEKFEIEKGKDNTSFDKDVQKQ